MPRERCWQFRRAASGSRWQPGGGDSDDGDVQVTGPAAAEATDAALAITHGGTANSVERDSENGATWEVEVTKTDGNTVDVRLDAAYDLVVIEGDNESEQGQDD